ncbi:MAG: ribonuclease III [Candidatus Liptonbacteria bacterium]|nr:ribonuclease III [Candidatus Liptonbacteria bacterium]
MVEKTKLEERIGYAFKNGDLLKEALTHRSYLNENPSWRYAHNERLEFLGDAVLELAVTEFLYAKFPTEAEGRLTTLRAALVNYQRLALVARDIGLEPEIYLSKGEAKDTGRGREVILANACEALVGALYLDAGYEAAKRFVERHVLAYLEEVLAKGLFRDPKSTLQETMQEEAKLTPQYEVLSETGPDHKKTFRVGVYAGEKLLAEGIGPSKQDAEIDAARQALAKAEQ